MITSIHHICIETPRYDESIKFYRDLLGFSVVEELRGFHGRAYTTWLEYGSIRIELQTPRLEEPVKDPCAREPVPNQQGLMHVCFAVVDLVSCLEHLDAGGFSCYLPGKRYYQVMGQSLSKLYAPEGTIIELREV